MGPGIFYPLSFTETDAPRDKSRYLRKGALARSIHPAPCQTALPSGISLPAARSCFSSVMMPRQ